MFSASEPVSVYLVDDHEAVLAGLAALIDQPDQYKVVGSTTSPTEAAAEIVSLQPNVAVIDRDIGGFDGLDLCRQLRDEAPLVACILLTAGLTSQWSDVDAQAAGVASVVLKQLVDFPLLDAIRAAAAPSIGAATG